jgi:arsenate reductase (thioredoxin)
MNNKKVLFIGQGNAARSIMAEAFMRRYSGKSIDVYSAGIEPREIDPMTVRVMEEIGINMDAFYSRPLGDYLDKMSFAYVIIVCAHAEKSCPAFFLAGGIGLHWDLEDISTIKGTVEERVQNFRKIRDQIKGIVLTWLRERGVPIEQ